MKRLLIIFAILLAFAVLAAAAGVFLFARGPSSGPARLLAWTLDSPLVDYSERPQLFALRRGSPRELAVLLGLLGRARDDERVLGLAVYIQQARLGFGKAQELRSLLLGLAAAGKSVDCYLETVGEGSNGTLAYFLASACQRVTVSPLAEVNLVGLYSDSLFIRGALDKLRITPQFAHVGPYKNAAEFYTETEHSAAAEEVLSAVLDDLFEQIVSTIASARDLSPLVVRDLIDRAPLTAEAALAAGLVDEIAYPDVFDAQLGERAGVEPPFLPLEEYRSRPGPARGKRVAVVFAQGSIVRGTNGIDPWSQQRHLGADSMREILGELQTDAGLLAVVLRIDSPGGSPVASDLILRQVELLAAEKPLVVSFSDVAASGGYYIAARAPKIVADPASITGSIGVVGGKLVTREFQQELLGVSHDTLSRGANADYFSAIDPWSQQQADQFAGLMRVIYDRFVDHVAAGRSLPREEVERVAGGRIWTGQQALAIGLVDELGGLARAIELALEAAGLPADSPVRLEFYPRRAGLLEILSRGTIPFLQTHRGPFPNLPLLEPPRALELPPELLRLFQPV